MVTLRRRSGAKHRRKPFIEMIIDIYTLVEGVKMEFGETLFVYFMI